MTGWADGSWQDIGDALAFISFSGALPTSLEALRGHVSHAAFLPGHLKEDLTMWLALSNSRLGDMTQKCFEMTLHILGFALLSLCHHTGACPGWLSVWREGDRVRGALGPSSQFNSIRLSPYALFTWHHSASLHHLCWIPFMSSRATGVSWVTPWPKEFPSFNFKYHLF